MVSPKGNPVNAARKIQEKQGVSVEAHNIYESKPAGVGELFNDVEVIRNIKTLFM